MNPNQKSSVITGALEGFKKLDVRFTLMTQQANAIIVIDKEIYGCVQVTIQYNKLYKSFSISKQKHQDINNNSH